MAALKKALSDTDSAAKDAKVQEYQSWMAKLEAVQAELRGAKSELRRRTEKEAVLENEITSLRNAAIAKPERAAVSSSTPEGYCYMLWLRHCGVAIFYLVLKQGISSLSSVLCRTGIGAKRAGINKPE